MADSKAKVVITADDQTRRGFDSALRGLKGLQDEARASAVAIGALGASLAAAAVGVAFAGFKSTVTDLAELDDAAEKSGTSVENLSKLLGTAAESGKSVSDLTGILTQLSRSVLQAEKDTSKAGIAFKQLGVDPSQFTDTTELLQAVAKALDQYGDGLGKTALAQAVLGRAGAEALPFLKDLANAQLDGVRVTSQQAAEAEKLEKAFNRIAFEARQLKNDFLGGLIPAINDLIVKFKRAREEGLGFFDALDVASPGFAKRVDQLKAEEKALAGLIAKREQFAQQTAALPSNLPDEFKNTPKPETALDREIAQRQKKVDELRRVFSLERSARDARDADLQAREDRGFQPEKPQATPPKGDEPRVKDPNDDIRAEIESMQRRIALIDDTSAAAQALYDIEKGRFQNASEGLKLLLLGEAKEYDLTKKSLELEKEKLKFAEDRLEAMNKLEIQATKEADEIVARELERQAEALREILAVTTKVRQEEMRRKQDLLDAAYFAPGSKITDAQYKEATDGINGLKDELKEVKTVAQELGPIFESAFENALIGGKKFKDVLSSIGQDIAKLFIRKSITEPAANSLGKLFEGFNLFKLFGGGKAAGGPVGAGMTYLVGEEGPELFVPKSSGTVIPNGSFGGGAVNFYQTMNFGSNVDQATLKVWAAGIIAQTKAQVLDSRKRGGAFAGT